MKKVIHYCPETERNSYMALDFEEITSNCRKEFGSSSTYGFFNGKRGFPKKCVCGSDVTIWTSKSKTNPGRPYFRCAATREDGHLFKWVEDGLYEEVQDMLQRSEGRELNELKVEVETVKEEILQCKSELKKSRMKLVVLSVGFCMLVVVIIYHMCQGKT